MADSIVRKVIKVSGMTCSGCEMRIENKLKKIQGVINVKASFGKSSVIVEYDISQTNIAAIVNAIEKLDYKVLKEQKNSDIAKKTVKEDKKDKMSVNQLLGIGIILFALYMIIKNTVGFNFIPEVNQNMGYGILFVVGMLTSLHCVAMCGGINLSQCVSYKYESNSNSKFAKLKPSLLYNSGRVVSYTIIGGIVGALGSVVSFSGTAKGIVAILSGIFMVIMGLNMLNIFPWLRKLNPKMTKIFGQKIYNNKGKYGPFLVGILNGLMPCGPLQAMQLYALGTGSFVAGATSMLLFSLGTVPLMFGFGAVSSFLSGKFTHKMLKVSAVLVMVLGVIMVNRGLSLSGVSFVSASPNSSNIAKVEGNYQTVTTTMESGKYTPIVVKKGIPVKWTIKANKADLNGCNNPVTIPKYNISKKLVEGDNLIEFTPEEEGNITYTCWMGMISSTIKVVSDLSNVSDKDIQSNGSQSTDTTNATGGSCCAASSKATKFANGNIPVDDIKVAKIESGKQDVTINVNDEGYSPAVVVVQRGVDTKIKFNPEKLNSCNNSVIFPDFQGQLDLQNGQTETPYIKPDKDFTFNCWMGMLHGYVKVVDDINNINLDQIKNDVQNYKPAGGGGCCGG